MLKSILILTILIFQLNAYEIEDKLKVVMVGKIANYITYINHHKSTNFIITVYKNRCGNFFDNIYKNKKIKNKPVKIIYIDNIKKLKNSDILYIPKVNSLELSKIIKYTNKKNILTVSDNRGFAERGGIVQLYFVSQKIKLKLNTTSASQHNLKIKPTLLRIAKIVKGYN